MGQVFLASFQVPVKWDKVDASMSTSGGDKDVVVLEATGALDASMNTSGDNDVVVLAATGALRALEDFSSGLRRRLDPLLPKVPLGKEIAPPNKPPFEGLDEGAQMSKKKKGEKKLLASKAPVASSTTTSSSAEVFMLASKAPVASVSSSKPIWATVSARAKRRIQLPESAVKKTASKKRPPKKARTAAPKAPIPLSPYPPLPLSPYLPIPLSPYLPFPLLQTSAS